jgi:hypothetical protein
VRFDGIPGGRDPQAGLTAANGALYGTTALGGSKLCTGGCGTLFTLSP